MIQSIELTDFRNFTGNLFQFEKSDVVLTGPNGSGKTSILESIYYLSILHSFRGAHSRELVRLGEHAFEIRGKLQKKSSSITLCVKEDFEGNRELEIGGERPRRSSEFIQEFHAVPFVPEDREIISGSSGFRRRFFDMLIASLDMNYMQSLGIYNRALAQRNRALKTHQYSMVHIFEPDLATQMPVIAAARSIYARRVEEAVNRMLDGRGEFTMKYFCDHSPEVEENMRFFRRNMEKDRIRGCTTFGPQLDEFEMRLDGKQLRNFGSTGQKGLIALLLKLAEFELIRDNDTSPVIVLADDVTGELDQWNVQLFLNTIAKADQRFFTFAKKPEFEHFKDFQEVSLTL